MKRERLHLIHEWALGDTVMFTALVRDLHRAYPGRFEISTQSAFRNLWNDNPGVVPFDKRTKPRSVRISWGDAIRWNAYAKFGERREMKHLLAWYHYDFERKTGIHVPVTEPRGELFLPPERSKPLVSGRYWVVLGGGKSDITNKHWPTERYQAVIDGLKAQGVHCVQTGATHKKHVHPPLRNCLNLVGKTDDAMDLVNLIAHADGVICPVTAAMHIAAVCERPCVVIAGGREEPWAEAYVDGFQAFGLHCRPVKIPHRFLHTVGLLPCCDKQGCWKRRTVPLEPKDKTPNGLKELCKLPIRTEHGAFADCMLKIEPDHVLEAVMDHYTSGILPPIGQPTRKYRAVNPSGESAAGKTDKEVKTVKPAEAAGNSAYAGQPTTEIQEPPTFVPPPILTPEPTLIREPSQVRVQAEHQKRPPEELVVVPRLKGESPFVVMDNPVIGGKFTVCVLCYGDHEPLARKCLQSILDTLPRERMDLRIIANECCPGTLRYVKSLKPDVLYQYDSNMYKYPAMRKAFWDTEHPLTTRYLIWLDDDAQCRDPSWAIKLAETVTANHRRNVRLYGHKVYHDLNLYAKNGHQPQRWFQQATWNRGVQLRVRSSQDMRAPNGSCIDFVVGWCWCVGVDAIRACDVPDARLNHNGGDVTIGAQIAQGGYKLSVWNPNKSLVWCPTKEAGGRRGFSEAFPWADPATRSKHVSGR